MPRLSSLVASSVRLIDRLLPAHVHQLPSSSLLRLRLSVGSSLFLLVLNVAFSPLTYLVMGSWGSMINSIAVVPMLSLNILVPRWSRSASLPGTLLSLECLFLLLMASVQPGGESFGSHICLVAIPLMASFLASGRLGLACTVICEAWVVARILVLLEQTGNQAQLEKWGLVATAWIIPVIGGLAWLYESLREKAELALQHRAAELARSNADLEQFAYVASHDLQEPLRLVSSYTQLVARRYRGKLDADADTFIDFTVGGVTRMQRLIQDLLTFSRVGSQRAPLQEVNTERVLERTLASLKVSVEECGAQVSSAPLPVVNGDESLLGQLFQNLISNALKFRAPDRPPRIHVDARLEGSMWVFSVRDNGIGIEPEYFQRIFVLFQRLHSRDAYEGTGIGLALCKRIVERHGGHIWVGSTSGQGSTFSFTLRAAGEPAS